MEKKYRNKINGWQTRLLKVCTNQGYWYELSNEKVVPQWYVECSSEWEEIKEKSYQIMAFRGKLSNSIYKLDRNNDYSSGSTMVAELKVSEISALNEPGKYEIYSVKRLSDNSLWQIGIAVYHKGSRPSTWRYIESFQLEDNGNMYINTKDVKYDIHIDYWTKLIEPEKAVGIHVQIGDSSYVVSEFMGELLKKLVDTEDKNKQ